MQLRPAMAVEVNGRAYEVRRIVPAQGDGSHDLGAVGVLGVPSGAAQVPIARAAVVAACGVDPLGPDVMDPAVPNRPRASATDGEVVFPLRNCPPLDG